ncbi:UNVERIFIED_CONTAM: N-acetylmuramoyl-L-alanine amidase, partial [Salmonella enterica subsp. enterica serovar Weltevreden]
ENLRCKGADYDDGVKAIALHHTAGSNNYTRAQAAAQVRAAYTYHAQNLGWCDIGYNALVDKYGTIYEGRYGGLDKAVQG